MKALILGRGYLGPRLARGLARSMETFIPFADIHSAHFRSSDLTGYDAVVNAFGKTGRPNIDWCETHREETYRSNVIDALELAEACAKAGVYLVHLSSGCIFYGDRPGGFNGRGWGEDDAANPQSFYSRTKYAADLVLSQLPNVVVVRLRMPIDHKPHPRNLITKLASYNNIIDVTNSVTVVDDLVAVVGSLIEKRVTGVFHVVNPNPVSHREILDAYQQHVDASHRCVFIPEHELQLRTAAPRSTAVLSSLLEAAGIRIPPVDLDALMKRYASELRATERGAAKPST